MTNVEKFERFLTDKQLRIGFQHSEDGGCHFYKSVYEGSYGLFEYIISIYDNSEVEVSSPIIRVEGTVLRNITLKELNALNLSFKGLKFIINNDDEIVMIYTHTEKTGEFTPEFALDNAMRLFQQAQENIAPLIIELHKAKEKAEREQNL